MQTTFENNTFTNNTAIQNVLVPYKYHGSLIEFVSELAKVRLNFKQNTVSYNNFIGDATALIGLDGGINTISDNILKYNGYLSEVVHSNHPDDVKTTSTNSTTNSTEE